MRLVSPLSWWLSIALVLACVAAAPAGPIAIGEVLERAESQPPRLAGVLEGPVRAQAGRLRFFALGDLPYSEAEYVGLSHLLDQAGQGCAPFVVHVGDIKGGRQPCSDAHNSRIAALFREQPVPVLYTPGDNEWTDCHRLGAGRHDPLERLAALRRAFFADPSVLHQSDLRPVMPDSAYPENVYFVRNGVLVALIHVVGSENNHRPRQRAAMTELTARSAANRALLRRATIAARALDARAFVVVFHANPLFERAFPHAGFAALYADLHQLMEDYAGPVLVIHGDTHRYRLDQPLRDGADPTRASRLWRLEVPGSPIVGGVWVSVEADAATPFKAQMVYPSALKTLEALRGD